MANAMIGHPIIFTASSYVLRVTLDGVTNDLNFTVTAGRYYWMTGDGQADASTLGGVGDILLRLKACLETHPGVWTCNVTLTAGFRINVAINTGATTFSILWTHANTTLDRTIFGFTADTVSGSTATAANLPKGLWKANRPINEDGRKQPVIVAGISTASNGDSRVSYYGEAESERSLFFDRLLKEVALNEYATATEPYGTIEYAWRQTMVRGHPFRLYLDETVRTSVSYELYAMQELERPWERADFAIRWALNLSVRTVTT